MKRGMLLGTLGVAALCTAVGVQADEFVYEEGFVQRQPSPAQCTAWKVFSGELVEQDYTLLTMLGTKDPDGISCSDPDVIGAIAKALNTNNQARQSWACDGRTWMTGGCGGGVELSAANSICSCPNPEYIVRPCIGNANWGGINTATCTGDTQTMTVIFAAGPPEPTACCLPDESCEMLLPDDCEGQNGIVNRGKKCREVDCSGACCKGDGSCEVTSEQTCADEGGKYNKGLSCRDVQCAFACCLPDGSCEMTGPVTCADEGGIFNEGSDCEDVDCTGACCLPDKSCKVKSEQECADVDGRYNKGQACNEVNCEIGSIAVGGTATLNIVGALKAMGLPFEDFGRVDPPPDSADIIIIGRDGGQALGHDYRDWLDGGGDLILTGGSSLSVYCDSVNLYFNTDGSCGWHTDGDWTSVGDHPANQGLPSPYAFGNIGHTFHMLHFTDDTPDTVIYGENAEVNNIAAFREYGNGGSFNYMALDLGVRNLDEEAFIYPWVAAALNAVDAGNNCFYTIKKSKAKKKCETCPPKGDDYRSEASCEEKKDCRKKVKTKINCPDGPGFCKIKAKKRRCE